MEIGWGRRGGESDFSSRMEYEVPAMELKEEEEEDIVVGAGLL